jgi:hypothetical protein
MNFASVAEYIHDELFEAHRGVIHLSRGDFLAFGNDGFATDDRTKCEVAAVRSRMAGRATEMGFATTASGYSWVMLLRLPEEHATEAGREAFRTLLTLTMWEAWCTDSPPPDKEVTKDAYADCQQPIAEAAINRAGPELPRRLLSLLRGD